MIPLAEIGGIYALPGSGAIALGIVALVGGVYSL